MCTMYVVEMYIFLSVINFNQKPIITFMKRSHQAICVHICILICLICLNWSTYSFHNELFAHVHCRFYRIPIHSYCSVIVGDTPRHVFLIEIQMLQMRR